MKIDINIPYSPHPGRSKLPHYLESSAGNSWSQGGQLLLVISLSVIREIPAEIRPFRVLAEISVNWCSCDC